MNLSNFQSGSNPINITSEIVIEITGRILGHYLQGLEDTLVGRMLSSIGLIDKSFKETIEDVLKNSIKSLFEQNPNYQTTAVYEFLNEDSFQQQLIDHMRNMSPINLNHLEDRLIAHIDGSISKLVLEKRGITAKQIINTFMRCYRSSLTARKGNAQIAVLYLLVESTEKIVSEVETNTTEIKKRLTTISEQVALSTDYVEDLLCQIIEHLVRENKKQESSAFGVFISCYDKEKQQYIEQAVNKALGDNAKTTSKTDLISSTDSTVLEIIMSILKSEVVVVDISDMLPTAFFEIGVALSLNKQIIILQSARTSTPLILAGYDIGIYEASQDVFTEVYSRLDLGILGSRELDDTICKFCRTVCRAMSLSTTPRTYLLLGSTKLLWRDVTSTLGPKLTRDGFHHSSFLGEQSFLPKLCDLRTKAQVNQFSILHTELADETSYIALGLVVGHGRPWLVLSNEDRGNKPHFIKTLPDDQYILLEDDPGRILDKLDEFLRSVNPTTDSPQKATKKMPLWREISTCIDTASSETPGETNQKHDLTVLVYIDGQYQYKVPLVEGLKVGRADTNDICVNVPYVSGEQFEIFRDQFGNYHVRDMGTNSSYLNDRLLKKETAPLKKGDTIFIVGAKFQIWDHTTHSQKTRLPKLPRFLQDYTDITTLTFPGFPLLMVQNTGIRLLNFGFCTLEERIV
jgi:pSer/pThr/pTyr-binding forkhead associated (FHA) protein